MVKGSSLDGAIAATVAYLDVFACAARPAEIHKFLVGMKATRQQVDERLSESAALRGLIGEKDGLWFMRGKSHLVPRRIRFLEHSQRFWPQARRIARTVERSGLATCGMVTGSLAADNADEHADIDFLFIYPAHRTWSSFAALRLLAKVPGMQMGDMCPNYAVPDDRLAIKPQNLFTAWELAKAVPLFGYDVYARTIRENAWVAQMLPNALPMLDVPSAPTAPRSDPRLVRTLTDNPAFRWLESREKDRKFRRDIRDVGVDMNGRVESGSVDRHSPTRPYQAMCEFRYRLDILGLTDHPMYERVTGWTAPLDDEMSRWGTSPIQTAPRPEAPAEATAAL